MAVGLGTDSPASGGDYDLRAEARACRAAHAAVRDLDDAALLRLITLDAARGDRDGRARWAAWRPARRADLVALRPAGRRRRPRGRSWTPRTHGATWSWSTARSR